MPYIGQTRDLSTQYLSYGREENDFRPVGNVTYPVGSICQVVTTDLWIYPDACTVNLPATGTIAVAVNLVGAVSDDFNGFNPIANPVSYLAPGGTSYLSQRGTTGVRLVTKGYHSGVLIDQSGSSVVTVTNGVLLGSAVNTSGYAAGYATAPTKGGQILGSAVLPASGIGSSLTAGSLAQASNVFTVATPASGDIVNTKITSPYVSTAPGVAQTTTWSLTLNAATAVSATTAGNAITAFLNAQPSFSQYYTATNSAGAVTVTVNALSNPFLVNFGTGSTITGQFNIGVSGVVPNTFSTVGSVTGAGGTTYSAAATTFGGSTAGTGYKGICPAWIGSYGNMGV